MIVFGSVAFDAGDGGEVGVGDVGTDEDVEILTWVVLRVTALGFVTFALPDKKILHVCK